MAHATPIEKISEPSRSYFTRIERKNKTSRGQLVFISTNDTTLIFFVYNILEQRVRTLSTPCIVQK
jgi:hypothetical protein